MADAPLLLAYTFAALYGVVLGSFWNVAIHRLPDGHSLWPRSACPRCGAAVAARDNVPIVSYVLLRGACRDCKAPISARYPLVEVLGGLLGVLVLRNLGPTLDLAHAAAWVVQFGFVGLLVVGAFVDLRHRILPDEVTIYATPFGIAGAWLLGAVGYDGWLSHTWQQAVLGACVWMGLFWLVAWVGRISSGGDVLGYGDVKLVGLFGAFLGPLGAFVAVMWGSILGSIVGIVALLVSQRRVALPFGPQLAIGALLFLFLGEPFVDLMFPQWGL